MIVSLAARGGPDAIGRILAERMKGSLGQPSKTSQERRAARVLYPAYLSVLLACQVETGTHAHVDERSVMNDQVAQH
jgi:hypothetical protein